MKTHKPATLGAAYSVAVHHERAHYKPLQKARYSAKTQQNQLKNAQINPKLVGEDPGPVQQKFRNTHSKSSLMDQRRALGLPSDIT